MMKFSIQLVREDDGRWVAELPELSGVMVYGSTSESAVAKVKALALRLVADRLERSEVGSDLAGVSFAAA